MSETSKARPISVFPLVTTGLFLLGLALPTVSRAENGDSPRLGIGLHLVTPSEMEGSGGHDREEENDTPAQRPPETATPSHRPVAQTGTIDIPRLPRLSDSPLKQPAAYFDEMNETFAKSRYPGVILPEVTGLFCSDGTRSFGGLLHNDRVTGDPFNYGNKLYLEPIDGLDNPRVLSDRYVHRVELEGALKAIQTAKLRTSQENYRLEKLRRPTSRQKARLTQVKRQLVAVEKQIEQLEDELADMTDYEQEHHDALFEEKPITYGSHRMQARDKDGDLIDLTSMEARSDIPFATLRPTQFVRPTTRGGTYQPKDPFTAYVHEQTDGQGRAVVRTTYKLVSFGPANNANWMIRIEKADLTQPRSTPHVTYCW